MARTRSSRGKEREEDAGHSSVENVKQLLPERLFATDRFPSERTNIYSTSDFLLRVRDALKGSPEMLVLLSSCFGGLFNVPARNLYPGRVVHSMMTRQLVTKKKYEMWPVFAGKPFRFSLIEFGEVTGLPCGEFEDGYTIEYQLPETDENYRYWEELIGNNRDVLVEDLLERVETEKDMPGWKKLKLCLIVIVDGVLIATLQKPKPSLKHVQRLEDVDAFLAFPWGRESFLWTLSTLKPGPRIMGKCEDPVGDLVKKLRQKSVRLVGFPQALQLTAFRLIPQLQELVRGDITVTLLDYPGGSLPQHAGLTVADVQKAEHKTLLQVQPMLEVTGDHEDRWGVWDEERFDKKVEYLLRLLGEGHGFSKSDWGGGDASGTLFVFKEKDNKRKRKSEDAEVSDIEPEKKEQRLSKDLERETRKYAERQEEFIAGMEEMRQEITRLKALSEKQGRQLDKLKNIVKGRSSARRGYRGKHTKSPLSFKLPVGGVGGPRRGKLSVEVGDASLSKGVDESPDGDSSIFKTPKKVPPFSEEGINEEERGKLDVLVGLLELDVTDKDGEALDVCPMNFVDAVTENREDLIVRSGDAKDCITLGRAEGENEQGTPTEKEVSGSKGGVASKEEIQVISCFDDVGGGLGTQCEKVWESLTTRGAEEGLAHKEEAEGLGIPILVKADSAGNDSVAMEGKGAAGEVLGTTEPRDGGVIEDNPLDESDDAGSGDEVKTPDGPPCVDVGDSPVTRSAPHRPVAQEEELAAVLLGKDQYVVSDIVPTEEDVDYPFFEKVLEAHSEVLHLNAGGHNVDNQFFLDLATPQKWITSTHMEVLMEHIDARCGDVAKLNRAMFLPPWFTAQVQRKVRHFNAAKAKDTVAGDVKITKYITQDGLRWGVDVDTLYAPMIWGDDHWVGLCISLTEWSIHVLDPNPKLNSMEAVNSLMKPLAEMLPYIAQNVCPSVQSGDSQQEPFLVDRMGGAYVNLRSGDCGPVAVKYMEILATGNNPPSVAGLTDELVDIFRKQYAMDIYGRLVLPLYLR
ncbi:ULP_PROTEASE domain-containing protein [Raphanus sativus]|nr:ULP_PROTEASE domain-containing protein [Raphanus sativus]